MTFSAARYFPGVFAKRNGNSARQQISAQPPERSESSSEGAAAEAEISDESLVLRLQEKDVSALGLLYRRYARLVYSVSLRIIRDPVEAEDLVHEVFLSLYRRCGSFDSTRGTARSWLVQMTYHKCFDWRDYLKARHGFQQRDGEGKAHSASPQMAEDQDTAEQSFDIDLVKDALRRLSIEQQRAFELRAAGYTFPEIAEKLGCPVGNAKNHVYRGIRRLRQILFDGKAATPTITAQQETKLQAKSAVQ